MTIEHMFRLLIKNAAHKLASVLIAFGSGKALDDGNYYLTFAMLFFSLVYIFYTSEKEI